MKKVNEMTAKELDLYVGGAIDPFYSMDGWSNLDKAIFKMVKPIYETFNTTYQGYFCKKLWNQIDTFIWNDRKKSVRTYYDNKQDKEWGIGHTVELRKNETEDYMEITAFWEGLCNEYDDDIMKYTIHLKKK